MEYSLVDILSEQPIDLPIFNPIALELMQQLASPDVSYFEVIKTIKKDQAISLQVLKMANSASYSGLTKCETIENAAIRLGTQQLANLAIAASHASLHSSYDLVTNEVMQYLWQHSYSCALGCRMIASQTGHQQLADHAYLAGLLHDVGKLYLIKALERIQKQRIIPGLTLNHGTVWQVFSALHVEFGCRVMDFWNIPEIYREVVAGHHLDLVEGDDFLLAIVRLVNIGSRRFSLSRFCSDSYDQIEAEMGTLSSITIRTDRLEAVMKGAPLNEAHITTSS